jgi:16S rRNA C1402 (ribose-2'-O) methylase RsmI
VPGAFSLAPTKEILGDRPAFFAREVTKLHEEFIRGAQSELAAALEEKPARGEITLLIGAPLPGQAAAELGFKSYLATDIPTSRVCSFPYQLNIPAVVSLGGTK